MEKRKYERPKTLKGITYRKTTGCGKIYITMNEDEKGDLIEVFASMGKAGGCAASQTEAICRILSIGMRHGAPPEEMSKQLSGIQCHSALTFGEDGTLSCADAIGKVFQEYIIAKANNNKITRTLAAAA